MFDEKLQLLQLHFALMNSGLREKLCEMLRILQMLRMRKGGVTAVLRERPAEDSQNAANSLDSEVVLCR